MKNKISYPKIYSFEDATKMADEFSGINCTKTKNILLGNGFSRSYYGDKFNYTTLFDAIKEEKNNERIKEIFEKYGNSNFEGVLRLLQDASWLNEIYKISNKEIISDYNKIKKSLSEAIVKVHPEHTGKIEEDQKKSCFNFLNLFENIFTVNYDLLLYWVIMTQEGQDKFGDYFTKEEDTPEGHCEFVIGSHGKHIHFLHGALHLFQQDGAVLKIVWGETVPLVSQVRDLMEKGIYPLVVAEGNSKAKVKQIKNNPYLKYIYDKFKLITGQLFTFGFSMSEQDEHILKIIKNNEDIRHLWIGIRGDFKTKHNKHFIQIANDLENERSLLIKNKKYNKNSKKGDLKVRFFDAGTMNIWGNRTAYIK